MGGDGQPNTPYHYNIRIHNQHSQSWSGVIHIDLLFPKKDPRFFLPAFMYGRNRGEFPQNVVHEFPRIRETEARRPSSPWWMVRSDRLSHPVVLAYDQGMVFGFQASPYFVVHQEKKQQWQPNLTGSFYQYCGYSCSIEQGSLGYTLGYENAPWLFVKSRLVQEREPLHDNCFQLLAGEIIEIDMYVYTYAGRNEQCVNLAIKDTYARFYQAPRAKSTIEDTVADLAAAISTYAWLPEDVNYSGQVFEDQATGNVRYNKIISLSWTNGLSVAVPMLMAALRLKNETYRQQSLACINNILAHALNPVSGLPYDAYNDGVWSVKGWWFDGLSTRGHAGYLVGQALYYIVKAYDYEKRLNNCIHAEWLNWVKNVLRIIEKTRNTDHEYPYVFSEKTAAGLEYDSFGSAWCLAAHAYYAWLTGDHTYLDGLLHSEQHYYETYVQRMECYGAPLDTNKATDSEGILAYIRAVRFLHAITNNQALAQHLEAAINYEFSWKFCYNSPIKTPPLSTLGWSSCGGSVTSIANPHIHPMSNTVVDELLYFATICHDDYVRQRMDDTVKWGCQSYNTYDNEFDYGKKGWMSERFCHSQGLLTEHYPDGSLASTWFCLMPWAAASIIEGLAGEYWDFKNVSPKIEGASS